MLEAETQIKNFEQSIYAAQESVARAENALKMMINADRRAPLWSQAPLPVTPVDLEAPRVMLEDAVTSALAQRVFDWGAWVISLVFLARAVGEFRYVGFFKRVRHTDFARRDTWLFSPLCLFIAVSAGVSGYT